MIVQKEKKRKESILMELPRELQVYIYSFLYDKWLIRWKSVMKEMKEIEIESKIQVISGLYCKRWNKKRIKICLECGDYYNIPMYGSLAMYCRCD